MHDDSGGIGRISSHRLISPLRPKLHPRLGAALLGKGDCLNRVCSLEFDQADDPAGQFIDEE